MAWTNSTGFPHDHDSSNSLPHLDYMNGKIIIISLIILVILTIFIITFHVYARLFWQPWGTSTSWYRNLHGLHEMSPTGGLDKAIVDSLPNFTYTVRSHHEGGDNEVYTEPGAGVVECAVCLNEFEDNDACRLLPKCNHSFHTQCIDMWFLSNTTCPVCRTSAQVLDSKNAHHGESSAACLLPCQDIGGHKETPNSSRLQPHQGTTNDLQSPKFSSTACMLPQKDIASHVQRPRISSLLGGEHEQGPGLQVRGMLLRSRSSRVDARYDMAGEEMHNIDSTHGLMSNYESGIYCNSQRHPSHSGQELALFRHLHLPNWRRSVSDRFLNIRQCVQFPSSVHSHLNSHMNTDHWQVGGRSLPHIIIDIPTPQDSFRVP